MAPKKMLDALLGVSDDSDASSSGEESEPEQQPAKKAKQPEIDVEQLQRHGYTGGLSVLLVPEKHEEGGANWAWCAAGTAAAACLVAEQRERRTEALWPGMLQGVRRRAPTRGTRAGGDL